MANQNMANREVCDLIFVDYSTKKPFLNLDFANVTTKELTGENIITQPTTEIIEYGTKVPDSSGVVKTKSGSEMGYLTLSDISGTIEGILFPKTYARFRNGLSKNSMVFICFIKLLLVALLLWLSSTNLNLSV